MPRVQGPLRLRLLSIDADHLITVFQLRKGYSLKDMRRDTDALRALYRDGGAANAKAFRNMQRNVIAHGGGAPPRANSRPGSPTSRRASTTSATTSAGRSGRCAR